MGEIQNSSLKGYKMINANSDLSKAIEALRSLIDLVPNSNREQCPFRKIIQIAEAWNLAEAIKAVRSVIHLVPDRDYQKCPFRKILELAEAWLVSPSDELEEEIKRWGHSAYESAETSLLLANRLHTQLKSTDPPSFAEEIRKGKSYGRAMMAAYCLAGGAHIPKIVGSVFGAVEEAKKAEDEMPTRLRYYGDAQEPKKGAEK